MNDAQGGPQRSTSPHHHPQHPPPLASSSVHSEDTFCCPPKKKEERGPGINHQPRTLPVPHWSTAWEVAPSLPLPALAAARQAIHPSIPPISRSL